MKHPNAKTPQRYKLFDRVLLNGVPGQIVSATLNVHAEREYGVRITALESELEPDASAEEEAA